MDNLKYIWSLKEAGMTDKNLKKTTLISGKQTKAKKQINFWLFPLFSVILSIIFFLQGCEKYLEENPDNRIELKTVDDFYAALTGAYPEAWHLFTEIMSDNYRFYDYSTLNSGTLVSWFKPLYLWSDQYILNLPIGPEFAWDNYYHSIYVSNVVLEGIDNAEGNEFSKRKIKGEALLIRAYCHFMLVNLFSRQYEASSAMQDLGIAYVVETEKKGIVHYKRDNLAYVYDQVEKDALQGLQLIGDENSDFAKYHFSRETGYAFMSRYYLFTGEWEKCVQYSDSVLRVKSTVRNLIKDYHDYFDTNDFEGFEKDYCSSRKENILLMNKTLEWNSYPVNGFYANEFRTGFLNGDLRGNLFVFNDNTNINWHSTKLFGQYKDGQQYSNVALFTVEEVLLNRAEALVRKENPDIINALKDLNRILQYRYETYTPLTPAMFSGSPVFILERIIRERRFEFCYEGFRWFDLKRFKIPVEHVNGPVTVFLAGDDLRYVLQIPEKERSANELMKANPR